MFVPAYAIAYHESSLITKHTIRHFTVLMRTNVPAKAVAYSEASLVYIDVSYINFLLFNTIAYNVQ